MGSAWNGIVTPQGTPQAVVEKLNAVTRQVLAAEETRKAFDTMGMEAVSGSPKQFADFLAAERKKWARVVTDDHIKAE